MRKREGADIKEMKDPHKKRRPANKNAIQKTPERLERPEETETPERPEELQNRKAELIPAIRELLAKKIKKKFKFSIISKVLIIFALGLVVILRYGQISELGYKTDGINKENEKILESNGNLNANIQKEIDLAKIRQIAESKLGLKPPDANQIIYINTYASDKSDYFDTESNVQKGFFQSVIDWFKNLF